MRMTWYDNDKTILRNPMSIIIPIPTDTMMINGNLGIDESTDVIWSARTITSGSAMVATVPMIKADTSNNGKFRFEVSLLPINSPVGKIPISMPVRNRLNPKMMNSEAITNPPKTCQPSGAMERCNTNTIKMMGSTDSVVSFSLASIFTYRAPSGVRYSKCSF